MNEIVPDFDRLIFVLIYWLFPSIEAAISARAFLCFAQGMARSHHLK